MNCSVYRKVYLAIATILLQEAQCNPNCVTCDGQTPLDMTNKPELIHRLQLLNRVRASYIPRGHAKCARFPRPFLAGGAEEGLGTRLVLVVKAEIIIGALCIPLILTVLAKVVCLG